MNKYAKTFVNIFIWSIIGLLIFSTLSYLNDDGDISYGGGVGGGYNTPNGNNDIENNNTYSHYIWNGTAWELVSIEFGYVQKEADEL